MCRRYGAIGRNRQAFEVRRLDAERFHLVQFITQIFDRQTGLQEHCFARVFLKFFLDLREVRFRKIIGVRSGAGLNYRWKRLNRDLTPFIHVVPPQNSNPKPSSAAVRPA